MTVTTTAPPPFLTMAPGHEDNSQQPTKLLVPYTLSKWPWRRMVNPHEKEVDLETKAWLRKFPTPAGVSRWEATIEKCRAGTYSYRACSVFLTHTNIVGLLAALAAPTASKGSSKCLPVSARIRQLISYFPEQLRIGSDLLYIFHLIDDQTDVESLPVVRQLVDIMIDALNNPDKPRPEGEAILGRIVKESVKYSIQTCL